MNMETRIVEVNVPLFNGLAAMNRAYGTELICACAAHYKFDAEDAINMFVKERKMTHGERMTKEPKPEKPKAEKPKKPTAEKTKNKVTEMKNDDGVDVISGLISDVNNLRLSVEMEDEEYEGEKTPSAPRGSPLSTEEETIIEKPKEKKEKKPKEKKEKKEKKPKEKKEKKPNADKKTKEEAELKTKEEAELKAKEEEVELKELKEFMKENDMVEFIIKGKTYLKQSDETLFLQKGYDVMQIGRWNEEERIIDELDDETDEEE